MMKIMTATFVLLLSGCTTIHFDNGNEPGGTENAGKWHHNFALALYEASPPVNLEQECAGEQWTSVKTELTFVNGLASGVVNYLAPIWYPKTVQVSCN